MASISFAVLAGIQKSAPRSRLSISPAGDPVRAAMASAVIPLSSSLCTRGLDHPGPHHGRLGRRRRPGSRAGRLVGDLEQGAVEVSLVEGEPDGNLREEEEELEASHVIVGVGGAAVLVPHPEFFGKGAEAVGLGSAPTRRCRRHNRRDDLAVDHVREPVVALADVLVDDDDLSAGATASAARPAGYPARKQHPPAPPATRRTGRS